MKTKSVKATGKGKGRGRAERVRDVEAAYDSVADEYVRRIYDELQHKPLDRELLDRFAASIPNQGLICDMGTGPGHVARYLHERGANVCGIDLASEMIDRARRLNPEIKFQQGNMFGLDFVDETFAGVTAFYALVNIPPRDIAVAFREIGRVLKTGGCLLLAFHVGDDVLHRDEWWGSAVSLDFYLFRIDEMTGCLRSAGFEVEEITERNPYPEIEHQSQRAYVLARKLPSSL